MWVDRELDLRMDNVWGLFRLYIHKAALIDDEAST